jgi:hypothetical protein
MQDNFDVVNSIHQITYDDLELKPIIIRYYGPFIRMLLENTMRNTIRNTLLISTAAVALIAGAGLASAQGTNENAKVPGAAAQDQKAPAGKPDQHVGGLPQKSPAAAAPIKENPAPIAQAPVKEKPAVTAQAPAASKPDTIGQGSAAQTSGPPNAHTAPGVAKDETRSVAPAALSSEQHAKFHDALRGEKSERLTDVHFSTTVGEVIPETVHLYVLPVSILEYAPQYRGYEYIMVGDEILIVNPRTMRIVAVIAA